MDLNCVAPLDCVPSMFLVLDTLKDLVGRVSLSTTVVDVILVYTFLVSLRAMG